MIAPSDSLKKANNI